LISYFCKVWAIVWKDIIAELRTKEMVTSMLVFSILVIVIFNFAFDPGSTAMRESAPGILWVAFCFAGMLGLSRSFVAESENSCLQGMMLCPVDRSAIYLGKMLGNFIFMSIIELMTLPIFFVFFDLRINDSTPMILLITTLGTLGFTVVGTIISAISVNTKAREVLLPIVLFPLIVPVLIASVKATGKILAGKPYADISGWVQLLAGFDVIFLVVCFLTFEHAIEE